MLHELANVTHAKCWSLRCASSFLMISFDLGRFYNAIDEVDDSIDSYTKVIEIAPEDSASYINRGLDSLIR